MKFKIKKEKKPKILILGAGGPAGINFIKSIRLGGFDNLYGTESNKYHVKFAEPYVKEMFLIKNNPIEGIREIIREREIDFVHAQPDPLVKLLSENREKIPAKTFLPKRETIWICQDKYESAKIWYEAGLRADEPLLIEIRAFLTRYELNKALKKYGKIWLRATEGAGGRGSILCENVDTAYHWIRFWRSKLWRENNSWEQMEWMAQKYLPGRNLAWHSVWKNGDLICSQARERLEYIYPHLAPSGITGTPTVQRTVNERKINAVGLNSVISIDPKPNGIFCVDLKEDENGNLYPTEINPGRFFTTSYFFAKAGEKYKVEKANMPVIYLKAAFNEEIPKGNKYNILPENLYWFRHIDIKHQLYEGI